MWATFIDVAGLEFEMEAVIFTGLQGSGKSSFYKERFFSTHVRISLDLLRTRHRENRLLALCLETQQRFVIDNTNPARADRAKYITAVERGWVPSRRILLPVQGRGVFAAERRPH